MFNQPLNQELKYDDRTYKEEPSKLPYETPADVIDVGRMREGEVNKTMRRYAVLSSVAYNLYNTNYDRANKNMKELLPYHNIDNELSDGYSSVIYKEHQDKPNDVIISYRGTQNLTDLAVDAGVGLGSPLEKLGGLNTGYFRLAQDKYDATKSKYPNANITTTGHSLGGSEAYYIGKRNDVKSYIFNAGSSPLDAITEYGLTDNEKNISTHYHVSGDLVGGSKALLGSNKDKLITIEPHKWVKDLVGTLGAIALGGVLGNVPGAIAGGLAGASYSAFNDLHGLHNFLPTGAFKENLDPEDILFRWIKPMEEVSKRTHLTDFSKPINKKEFFKRCMNPYDPKCRLGGGR